MQETVSELIGKPLLTKSGEYLGCVKSVQTDARYGRIRNFACFDRDEEDFLLPASAIAQFGQDALVVQYASRRACKNCVPLPLKCKTYSQSGDELGAIDDFLRSGTELTGVVLSNGQAYPLERLVKVTDVAVLDLSDPFVPPKTRKAPAQKSAPPAKERARECAAAALPETETVGEQPHAAQAARYEEVASLRETAAAVAEESVEREEGAAPPDAVAETAAPPDAETVGEQPHAAQTAAPPKSGGTRPAVRAGKGLLTGKILPADLVDVRGNVLAPAGTRVTADVIRRAMAHNKLFALTMLCLHT